MSRYLGQSIFWMILTIGGHMPVHLGQLQIPLSSYFWDLSTLDLRHHR